MHCLLPLLLCRGVTYHHPYVTTWCYLANVKRVQKLDIYWKFLNLIFARALFECQVAFPAITRTSWTMFIQHSKQSKENSFFLVFILQWHLCLYICSTWLVDSMHRKPFVTYKKFLEQFTFQIQVCYLQFYFWLYRYRHQRQCYHDSRICNKKCKIILVAELCTV